jgi:hypothetical protein
MSTYKATSWGRTRRPKHLDENVPPSIQAQTHVTAVAGSSLSASLVGTNAGENGYVTENQRYLHVLVKTGNSKSVAIWGFNYAFGEWAPLYITLGSGVNTAAIATVPSSGEGHYIFEIAGVDRVAFVSSDSPGTVRAACSTF